MELITSCNSLKFQRPSLPFQAVASSFSLSQSPHSLSTRNNHNLRFHPPLRTSRSHTFSRKSLSTTCSVANDSTLSESFSKTQMLFFFLFINVLLNLCLLDSVRDKEESLKFFFFFLLCFFFFFFFFGFSTLCCQ
jgi:hypothetical protein